MSYLLAPPRLKRYAAIRLPSLSTDRLARLRPEYAVGPVATTRTVANTVLVEAVNEAAVLSSITPGMTLAGARAMCPALKTAPADSRADADFLEEVAGWCGGFTPRVGFIAGNVEGGKTAGLMLDITGCAHLFGGEDALLDRLGDGLDRFGLVAMVTLAGSPGTALALAARFGNAGGRLSLDPGSRVSEALGDLPVAALLYVEPNLDPAAVTGLDRVGLRRLSDLYSVPRASLAKRFGMTLVTALDKSLGHVSAPIEPRAHKRPWRVRIGFPDPIGLRGDIDAAFDRLLTRIGTRLADEDLGARRFDLLIERTDGTMQRLSIGTNRPARDPAYIARLFREKMDEVDPGYGIDRMILAARRVEAFDSAQGGLSVSGHAAGGSGQENAAERAVIDRIANRLGEGNLFRLAPCDTHLPDRAQSKRPPADEGGEDNCWETLNGAPRPVRLYARPRTILPAGATGAYGVPEAFRLSGHVSGRRLSVQRVEGPERIGPEWWRRDADWVGGMRDYFRVTVSDGRQLWLYREAPGEGEAHPRWFLHGIFP